MRDPLIIFEKGFTRQPLDSGELFSSLDFGNESVSAPEHSAAAQDSGQTPAQSEPAKGSVDDIIDFRERQKAKRDRMSHKDLSNQKGRSFWYLG
nr:hypothetical protein [uncultured Pseudomonas sp.]